MDHRVELRLRDHRALQGQVADGAARCARPVRGDRRGDPAGPAGLSVGQSASTATAPRRGRRPRCAPTATTPAGRGRAAASRTGSAARPTRRDAALRTEGTGALTRRRRADPGAASGVPGSRRPRVLVSPRLGVSFRLRLRTLRQLGREGGRGLDHRQREQRARTSADRDPLVEQRGQGHPVQRLGLAPAHRSPARPATSRAHGTPPAGRPARRPPRRLRPGSPASGVPRSAAGIRSSRPDPRRPPPPAAPAGRRARAAPGAGRPGWPRTCASRPGRRYRPRRAR